MFITRNALDWKQACEKFRVPAHVRFLNWRVRGRKTGRSLYDLFGDRSREHTQRFPRVSVCRCSPPKTGYQLYRPQFLTSCTLLANTLCLIDVILNRHLFARQNFHVSNRNESKKKVLLSLKKLK